MANQVLYGLSNYADVAQRLVTEVGVGLVNSAVQQFVQEHTRQLDALTSLFVDRTTDFKLRFTTPVAGRLQPLDENGRARPVLAYAAYDVSWPLQMAGTAWGANYIAMQKMTVQQVNDLADARAVEDTRWMRDHILGSLFYNTSWTWNDPVHGALTIQPLANGDSQTYGMLLGDDVRATDTHYLAQAAAIADAANPFPTIAEELNQHPENSGEVVVFVPTGLLGDIRGLTNFYPVRDNNISEGTATATLTGTLGVSVPGELVGYVDGCWIVHWRYMPANYMIAVTTDGERPLRMRQEPEASLQGFQFVATRPDYPYEERQFLRIAGFGAWNRVGALVYRIGNASYAVPAPYTVMPMA